jgi:hypothetical protein
MAIEPFADAIIELIKQNIIAKTNVTSDIRAGDTIINVENSFQFADYKTTREIVLIDYNYNIKGTPHYHAFEYSKIEEVNNTTAITLTTPIQSDWLVSNKTFIQKTIGHTPLYENNIYYGDREVIPLDEIAIAVEPSSVTNDWMYIQGGLKEEYKLDIIIYGRDIKFEDGRRILDRYSDSVYQLLMNNIHLNIDEYSTLLTANYVAGDTTLSIKDTAENRKNIIVTTPTHDYYGARYNIQDNNNGVCCGFDISNISFSGAEMILTMDRALGTSINIADFGRLFKSNRYYVWDSRVGDITYGKVSKGSAYLRASQLSWWGRIINHFYFPQKTNKFLPE